MFEIVSAALALSTMTLCLAVIIVNIMYPMGRKRRK